MQYILFTSDGIFKTIVGDSSILAPENGSFIIEVEDDFEWMGHIVTYVDGAIVKTLESFDGLPTGAEIELENVRRERSRLLSQTDWTQSEDIPQAIRDLWKPYRQELRDITKTYTVLNDTVWPTQP